MSGTARFALPFLSPGQAQKEFTHNEALQLLDIVVAAAVEDGPIADPPSSPAVGDCYIVGASPTGDWAGKANALMGYSSGGWRAVMPVDGMTVFVKTSANFAIVRDGAWEFGVLRGSRVEIGGAQVVGPRATAISAPAGGTSVDVEARGATGQILAALRQHGLIEP
jgi:hypothetical protein